jgi:prolipoprotein diacylglyceryltransferase
MFPTLHIGSLALPTAPLLTIASFWVGLWVAAREGKRFGLDEDMLFNAGFYGALGGLIGARLFYVLRYWSFYQANPGEIFALNLATLASFEGLVTGLLVATIYLQRKHAPAARLLDALAPGFAAFAIGMSAADLAAGTAYGSPAELPWAIDLWNAPRHPAQIYDAALMSGILAATLRMLRARPPAPAGRAFAVFVALFSAARLFTEGFRGDSALFGDGWRTMQFVWLAVLLIALVVLARSDLARRSGEDYG